MARIRTIKPEFWTDDVVTECSLSARLLFIGCWNFADDSGNIERSSKQMKMKIFPADTIETESLVLELIDRGLLIEYEVDNHKYLHIKGFTKHQVINNPSKTGHPKYDDSLRATVVLPEESLMEGKGREGKGKGKEESPPTPTMTPEQLRYRFEHTMGRRIINDGSQITILQGLCTDFTAKVIIEAIETTALASPDYPLKYLVKVLRNKEPPVPDLDPNCEFLVNQRKLEAQDG